MYRPSCLIEAHGSPEKYWLMYVGQLAIHLIKLNFIFLSGDLLAAAERAASLADVFYH
jgi:hypothetical protein